CAPPIPGARATWNCTSLNRPRRPPTLAALSSRPSCRRPRENGSMTQPTPLIPRFNSRFSNCGISCASLLASLGFLLGPFVLVVSAADKPQVERFDFGTEELGPLIPRGDVVRDQAGPRPPAQLKG